MRNDTKLPLLVSVASATPVCSALYTSFDGIDTIRICTGYRIDGEVREHPPLLPHRYAEVVPVYESLPGWTEPTAGITEFGRLPGNARRYLARLEELGGVPIDIVSTGAERDATIVLRHPFD